MKPPCCTPLRGQPRWRPTAYVLVQIDPRRGAPTQADVAIYSEELPTVLAPCVSWRELGRAWGRDFAEAHENALRWLEHKLPAAAARIRRERRETDEYVKANPPVARLR